MAASNTGLTAILQVPRFHSTKRTAHAHFCLGVALIQIGDFAESAASFKQAISLEPTFFLPLYYLGSLSILIGEVEDGLHFYRTAEQLLPAATTPNMISEVPVDLASQLPRHFFKHLTQIFKVQPMSLPMNQLKQDLSLLVRHYHMLDLSQLHIQLAMSLLQFGAFDEAKRHMQLITGTGRENLWLRAYVIFCTPVVFNSKSAGYAHRAAVVENVRQALHERHPLGDPAQLHDLFDLFYVLPHLGAPSHRLMSDIALMFGLGTPETVSTAGWLQKPEMLTRSMQSYMVGLSGTRDAFTRRIVEETRTRDAAPSRNPSTSSVSPRKPTKSPPIVHPKIGILSYKLFDDPMGKLVHHLVRVLSSFQKRALPGDTRVATTPVSGAGQHDSTPYTTPRGIDGFNVTIIRLRAAGDDLTRAIMASAHHVVDAWTSRSLNRNSTYLQKLISKQQFDALVVFDEGLDPLLYGVLQARMAPVQMVYRGASGHMQSTGMLNTVDFWLTGDEITPFDSQKWMNEQIVRVGSVGDQYEWAPLPTSAQHLQIAERFRLMNHNTHYLLSTGLEAISPDMDKELVRILTLDKSGVLLVQHEPGQALWAHKLKLRLRQTFNRHSIPIARVKFLHVQTKSELRALLNAVSVVLDTFPVGLGNRAFEALSVGTPVVTCSTCMKYSRKVAHAMLTAVNHTELIVHKQSEFAETAVKVAGRWTRHERLSLRYVVCESIAWSEPGNPDRCRRSPQVSSQQRESSTHKADVRKGTLIDWVQFVGRATAPWARLRHSAIKPLLRSQRAK